MTDVYDFNYTFMKRLEYTPSSLKKVIRDAVDWAEKTLRNRKDEFNKRYAKWRIEDENR